MIKLRVSTLESFRRVVDTPYGDEAELIERIRLGQWNEGPSNAHMRCGTAWHRALAGEMPDGMALDMAKFGDYWFHLDDIASALQHVGPGVCELTGRLIFPVAGRLVEVEGTCDRMHGLAIRDAKTKFSTPDIRDYEPSLQWRYYSLIHEAAWFSYDLFHMTEPDDDGYCRLKDIASARFWPYVGLEDDCRSWIVRFLEWAGDRGLLGLLEDSTRHAA